MTPGVSDLVCLLHSPFFVTGTLGPYDVVYILLLRLQLNWEALGLLMTGSRPRRPLFLHVISFE